MLIHPYLAYKVPTLPEGSLQCTFETLGDGHDIGVFQLEDDGPDAIMLGDHMINCGQSEALHRRSEGAVGANVVGLHPDL